MNNPKPIRIEQLTLESLPKFWPYLHRHLSENGQGAVLFQPLSRAQSKVDQSLQEKFETGISTPFGEIGWRKVWLAVDGSGTIMGHIDIRARSEPNTSARVLLGMGVDSQFRKQGVGQSLLAFLINYCRQHPTINWIDLEVLANNEPAIRLYEKMNFQLVGIIEDMFRIDGQSYGYQVMTLRV